MEMLEANRPSTQKMQENMSSRIQVLDRAFTLIELLSSSENGYTIKELSSISQLPKSTVHRILSNLRTLHYIEKDDETERYVIGYKFIEIASVYLNKMVLKTEAVPFMRSLANDFQCTSYLGILESNEVMYLEKIEPNNSIRLYREIGKREPLYCTGLGKVLLSGLSDQKMVQISNALSYQKFTKNTITDPLLLQEEVRKVGRQKYAMDNTEHCPDNSCLAMPIYDFSRNVMAAMSISRKDLFDLFEFNELYTKLKYATLEISKRMGFTQG